GVIQRLQFIAVKSILPIRRRVNCHAHQRQKQQHRQIRPRKLPDSVLHISLCARVHVTRRSVHFGVRPREPYSGVSATRRSLTEHLPSLLPKYFCISAVLQPKPNPRPRRLPRREARIQYLLYNSVSRLCPNTLFESKISSSATVTSKPFAASASVSAKAKSLACSGPTVPARPALSKSWKACATPTAAPPLSAATTREKTPRL